MMLDSAVTGRTHSNLADGAESSSLAISNEVPQGSILGPLFIYILGTSKSIFMPVIQFYVALALINLQSASDAFQISFLNHRLALPIKLKLVFSTSTCVSLKL